MADHPDGYIFPCDGYYPTGWGGTVTDSVTQGYPVSYLGVRYKSAEGVFGNSIGTTESKNTDLSTSAINDPARFVVAGDSAAYTMWSPIMDVYQVCGFQYGCADWENCEDTDICGIDWAHFKTFWTDVSWRKKYTRHMGGSNFGFADGHATWMAAETFLSQVTHQDCPCDAPGAEYHEGTIEGVGCYSNVFACPDW